MDLVTFISSVHCQSNNYSQKSVRVSRYKQGMKIPHLDRQCAFTGTAHMPAGLAVKLDRLDGSIYWTCLTCYLNGHGHHESKKLTKLQILCRLSTISFLQTAMTVCSVCFFIHHVLWFSVWIVQISCSVPVVLSLCSVIMVDIYSLWCVL